MSNTSYRKLGERACAILLAVTLALTSSLVVQTETQAAKKGTVNSVSITKPGSKSLVLQKGKKYQLKVNVKTSKKSVKKTVTYKSSNKSVAIVSGKGVIKAKKKGTATITVTSKANKKKSAKLNVVVGGTAVTKVSLNKKNAQINIGGKVTLKATISPKKPSVKGVTWSTSKKKVATVSAKGVVKGVAAGTANIIATANDGSGKSAKCKVTVRKAGSIVALEVVEGDCLKVTLDQAAALSKADFMVATRTYDSYRNDTNPTEAKTDNQVVYLLDLRYDVGVGERVRVTIPKLKGVKAMECVYKQSDFLTNEETYVMGMVGEAMEQNVGINGVRGSATITVTGNLPSGVTFNQKESNEYGRAYFYGTPTAVADNQQVTVTATDELGNVHSRVVTFLIADKNTLVVWNKNLSVKAVAGYNYSVSVPVVGGSGNYEVTYSGLSEYEHGDSSDLYVRSSKTKYAAGDISATITDAYNGALARSVVLSKQITPSVLVGGRVLDTNGSPIKGASVYLYAKEPFNLYYTDDSDSYDNYTDYDNDYETYNGSDFCSAQTRDDGSYVVRVPANATVKGSMGTGDGRSEAIRKFETGTTDVWDRNISISATKYKKVNVAVALPAVEGAASIVVENIYAESVTSTAASYAQGEKGYVYLPTADADAYKVYARVRVKNADGGTLYYNVKTMEANVVSADAGEVSVSLACKTYTVNLNYTCSDSGVTLQPTQAQKAKTVLGTYLDIYEESIPAYKGDVFIGYYRASDEIEIKESDPEVITKTVNCYKYGTWVDRYFNAAAPTDSEFDSYSGYIVKQNGETLDWEESFSLDFGTDTRSMNYGTYEAYFVCWTNDGKKYKTDNKTFIVSNSDADVVTIAATDWTLVESEQEEE